MSEKICLVLFYLSVTGLIPLQAQDGWIKCENMNIADK